MQPFRVSTPLRKLVDIYPSAELLIDIVKNVECAERESIVRLWMSEGIPFAFRECPGVYESIRAWLSCRLDIDPKEISISGSARLGESLAPKKLGCAFSSHSDLDLFVVSSNLFDRMREEFIQWSTHYENKKINPSNNKEKKYWKDNNGRGPKTIERGFLDSNMVPTRNDYYTFSEIGQSMWELTEKIRITNPALIIEKSSIRCYRTWKDCVRQITKNLSQ